jgi:hypothetical protein
MDQTPVEAKVMRGIINREHKKALAERREAQEAAAAAEPAIPPSTVGWSTRPDPKRKPSPADQAIAARVADQRQAWTRNNRAVATAERRLRKGRVEMVERWDHKREGTAETHEHVSQYREGSMKRLYLSGAIDAEQLAASVDIATVLERIGSDVAVRTASLEARVDTTRRGDGGFYEQVLQVRHEMAYGRWRAQVRGPIAPVLEMIAADVPMTEVARRYRMHNRRAKQLLIDALNLWPQILGAVCKEIDRATLAAAHAGILS